MLRRARPATPSGGVRAVEDVEAERLDRAGHPPGEQQRVAAQRDRQRDRARGPGGSGPRIVSTRRWPSGRYCSISSRQAMPAPGCAASSDATVGSSSWCSAIAVPSSNGWAMIASGRTQRSPSASSSSSRIAGDATVIGLNPAQWSWMKPGSVASTLEDAPPGRGRVLEDGDVEARAGEVDRAHQAGGAGADDDHPPVAGAEAMTRTHLAGLPAFGLV